MPSFPLLTRLLLVFLAVGFASQAEPIRPLLRPAAVAHLQAQLRQPLADTSRATLLLRLADNLLAQHEEADSPLNGAATYVEQAQTLSERANFVAGRIGSLYALGRLHTLTTPDTLGRPLLRQGIVLSQRHERRALEALGWYYLAGSYPGIAQAMPLKLGYYRHSQQLYHALGAQLEDAHLLKTIADTHLLQGNSEQAIHELRQVLALYRAAGHHELHYTYDLLLAANRQAGNYKEALRYGLAMLASAQATHDTVAIGGFYARVAGLYSELHQTAPALVYYQRALHNYQITNNKLFIVHAAGDIARLLIAQHQPQQALAFFTRTAAHAAASSPAAYARYMAECYVALRRYEPAERYFKEVVRLVEADHDNDMQKMYAYQAMGDFYVLTKRYGQARWYLQQSLGRYQRTGFLLGIAKLHLLLFKVDSAQGKMTTAIGHYQRYKLLNDSIFTIDKAKQLANLEIQYDLRKKEQNIALLTKQSQTQQARIRQREWQRNTLLAGAALLVLLLGLGYNRYRLKQRSNLLLSAQQQEINRKNASLELLVSEKQDLLEEKQDLLEEKEGLLEEKDWMLKEIHHRVKNNLQVISSLLSTQADYLREPTALAALRESQNRVQAMALVHQKLYQSDSLALVNMPEYIQEITERLLESFDCLDTVRERLDIAPLELDVALATPLGLIINEAVTNALKHAFPQHRPGTLTISLHPLEAQRYELLIADNGVGLPPDVDLAHGHSLGLTMVKGLSKQIDGVLHITQEGPGVQLTLQFEVARKQVRAKEVLA
jgi:two-component sensor histidine kinase